MDRKDALLETVDRTHIPTPVRFLVTREGRAPIRKLMACARGRMKPEMKVEIDFRLYAPAIGPPRPRSQRRFGGLIDSARRLGLGLRKRRLLGTTRSARPRTIVFADIERLGWDERRRAAALWSRLESASGVARLLNHPTRVLCRYELLRALRDRGWNDFGAYRVSEQRMPERYPVFLRGEDDHAGATSPLLESEAELRAELERRRAKGELRESTLIVEFCDTSDEEGMFRKYGAFRVGRHILPRHIFISRGWMLKSTRDSDGVPREEMARLESDYIERNPHAAELMARFELAGIEYGRIDYGLKDGRVQVWEIHTNPTLILPAHFDDPIRGPLHEAFMRRLDAALAELGSD